jgi:hypothetical protein
MVQECQRLGLKIMVGNMLGTSWSMAPAYVVGQYCEVVDLDGPLLLGKDREIAAIYDRGVVEVPPQVWGGRRAVANA